MANFLCVFSVLDHSGMTNTDVEGPIKAFSFGSKKNKNQIIRVIHCLKIENISKKKLLYMNTTSKVNSVSSFFFLLFPGKSNYLKPYYLGNKFRRLIEKAVLDSKYDTTYHLQYYSS